MKTSVSSEQAMEQVLEHAKGSTTEVRVCRRVEVGTVPAHQGDVYLHCVSEGHPRGGPLGTRQVAVGTTVGARHIVEGENVEVFQGVALPEWVTEPDWCEPGSLLGPVVVAGEGGVTLTHPEHANHCLPSGVYQVTYQADYRTQRRVQD